jgi:hypothetical protein
MSVLQLPLPSRIQAPKICPCNPRGGAVITRAASSVVNAAAVLPKNLIGIHSGVFVGDWRPEDAERAVKGAKEAGFDLIERTHASWGAIGTNSLVEYDIVIE